MTTCTQMSDFVIKLSHRPGELAGLAARMRAADVNLLGLWGSGEVDGEVARVCCVPQSAEQFRNFASSAELNVREGTTFYLTGESHVAGLVRTLETIAKAGINLRAIQSIALHGEFGCFVWADPKDWDTLKSLIA